MFSLAMLVLSKNYLEKFDFTKSILLTIALLLSAFGRRYFAYAVIAIAISVAIVAVMKLARTDKMHRKTFFLELLKSVSTICCLIIFVAIIFWKFIQNSISGTLAVVYSAYQRSDCLGNYWLLVKNYGVITCIIAVIGIIFMLKNKKNTQFLLELVLSFLICTYLFFRVQSMGNHHYYLTVIPILFFVAYCLGYCSIKKIRFLLGGMVTLLVFNMMVALVDIPLLLRVENLWTVQRMEPQIRSDIDQLQSMRRDLERWSDDGHVIYIIASSTIINDDLIRKMNMPDELISVENLCVSSHVDLRDGFPLMFLNSDVVVVTNPIQYHLNEEGQRVIGILAEEVTSGNLSKYFIKLTSYELDNGVVANVYARNSMFTDEDYYELIEQFDKYYFDYPELFRDRIEAYAGF